MFGLILYQTMLPANTMVQMNSPQINALTPQSQNRAIFANGVSSVFRKYAIYNPNVSPRPELNRPQIMQTGSQPVEMLQLVGLEMPPLRRFQYNVPMNGSLNNNNWQRRTNPSNSVILSPPHLNYNRQINAGSIKKSNLYNNKMGKRNPSRGGGENVPRQVHSSNNNFNFRSSTQGRYSDGSQSSDDRDSLSSLAEQVYSVKSLREMRHNGNLASNNNPRVTQQGSMPNASSFYHYQNQRPFDYQPSDVSPPRPLQAQNYQYKRRHHSEIFARNTPSPPRNQKNQRRFPSMIPPVFNLSPKQNVIAPDRFLARSHLVEFTQKPENLVNGSVWDELSRSIWEKFVVNQQTEETFRKKMMLWRYLYLYIKSFFPRYGLLLVGSTMNGFGSNSSDMDMCLVVKNGEMYNRIDAIVHLEQIKKCLEGCGFIENIELIQAKVPILKFFDTIQKLEVDLNCNCAVGIRNTHLLYCYSRIDWRVRPLVLVTKLWAQMQDINNAKHMTISSYSLVLMVIHFLQCGANPAILPCLHKLYNGKFEPMTDIHTIDMHEELDYCNSQRPQLNKQLLGELLVDFFNYYVNFDFSQYAISVRLARKIGIEECRQFRSFKNDPHQWKNLCIEEPFDQTNTAHSVYDPDVFERIKRIFKLSFEKLSQTRDLSSIFVKLNAET